MGRGTGDSNFSVGESAKRHLSQVSKADFTLIKPADCIYP